MAELVSLLIGIGAILIFVFSPLIDWHPKKTRAEKVAKKLLGTYDDWEDVE